MHGLIGIGSQQELNIYPKLGSFWEGYALEEVIRELCAMPEEVYFWGTQAGAELDLLLIRDGKKIGYEFKYTDRPKISSSMQIAIKDLNLDHLFVIYPGTELFPLSEKITARGLQQRPSLSYYKFF